MKVDQTHAVPPVGGLGHRASGRSAEDRGEDESREESSRDEVVLFGIPEEQMTPEVRRALDGLLARLEETDQALERATRKVSELEVLADRDSLTPAFNRRAFLRELDRAIALSARHRSPVSLVYIDIDNLKTLNDREGHAAGDTALKTLAAILDDHTRTSDVIGRIGGDEFALLLPHTNGDAAAELAARLNGAVNAATDSTAGLSISYGVHELDTSRETADQAMAAADEAMYAHKRRKDYADESPRPYAIISGNKASRTV